MKLALISHIVFHPNFILYILYDNKNKGNKHSSGFLNKIIRNVFIDAIILGNLNPLKEFNANENTITNIKKLVKLIRTTRKKK